MLKLLSRHDVVKQEKEHGTGRKNRWQIDIFFRFIKQNLKVKAVIGNSENAVMTQIYVV